ncbi:MAG: ABC transporter permease, partial [Lachnospiraceae bacterium]|nr:ABC transporter permease [Lachnospiraceae bacterium]
VVQGVFNNYQGRLMIMSFAGYRALFGSECRPNTIYTIPNAAGAKDDTIFQKLPSGFGLERSDSYLKRYSSLMNLYNAIVYLMIGMSVMLSFLVLTNLTNIFVSRKKKELIVMRVNGFNLKEAVGYLIRETVVTTAVGLIFGVAAGILIARMVTLMMEQPDVQLLRTPILKAWLYAAGLELLFALIIDWRAFRKVKTFSLSEIAES